MTYDVIIDIPRQGMLIRNPVKKYRYIQRIQEDLLGTPYYGKPTKVEHIPRESMKKVNYRIRPDFWPRTRVLDWFSLPI